MAQAREWRAELARAAAAGAAYGGIALAALSATRFGTPVESIWFSNAVLVWALVDARVRAWPWYFLFATAGHVSAHLIAGDELAFTLGFLVGDMSECLLAGFLLARRPGVLAFETRASTFYFLIVCGFVAPLASACVASAATWVATGAPLGMRDFAVWFSVDALGLLICLPLVHALVSGRWRILQGRLTKIAIAALTVGVLAALSIWFLHVPVLRLLLLPVFVVIAFELGVAGVQICLGVLLMAWIALTYQTHASPLWGEHDMRDNLLLVQFFLVVFAATVVPLAVALEEKQRLTDALDETLAETREAWGAIIGAEARYQLVVDNVSETVMRVAPGGDILFASPACTQLLRAERKFEGRNLFDLLHPDDRAIVSERVQQSVDHGLHNLAQRWGFRLQGDDESWHAIDARVTLAKLGAKSGEHEFIVVLRPEQV